MTRTVVTVVALVMLGAVALAGGKPRKVLKRTPEELIGTISASTSASTQVIAAQAGYRLFVQGALLSADTAGVYVFQDGENGTALAHFYLPANTPVKVKSPAVLSPGFNTTAGTALFVDGPSSSTLHAVISARKE